MLETYELLTPIEQEKAIRAGVDIKKEVNTLTLQNLNDLFSAIKFDENIELGRPAPCYVIEELTKRSIRIKEPIFYL